MNAVAPLAVKEIAIEQLGEGIQRSHLCRVVIRRIVNQQSKRIRIAARLVWEPQYSGRIAQAKCDEFLVRSDVYFEL